MGHVFNANDAADPIGVMDDVVNDHTRHCLRLVNSMSAYRGIALSLIRALVIESHRTYAQARSVDLPGKMIELQDASDDFGSIDDRYTVKQTDHIVATATKRHGSAILHCLETDVDVFFTAWSVATTTAALRVDSAEFTDSDQITDRVMETFRPIIKQLRLIGYGQTSIEVCRNFLDSVVCPVGKTTGTQEESSEWRDTMQWKACMVPMHYSVEQWIGEDEPTRGPSGSGSYDPTLFEHPLVQVYRHHYGLLSKLLGGSSASYKQEFYVLKFLLEEIETQETGGPVEFWTIPGNWGIVMRAIYARLDLLVRQGARDVGATRDFIYRLAEIACLVQKNAEHESSLKQDVVDAVLVGIEADTLQFDLTQAGMEELQVELRNHEDTLPKRPKYDLLQAMFNGLVLSDPDQQILARDFRTYLQYTTNPEQHQQLGVRCLRLLSQTNDQPGNSWQFDLAKYWDTQPTDLQTIVISGCRVGFTISPPDKNDTTNSWKLVMATGVPVSHVVALHLVAQLIDDLDVISDDDGLVTNPWTKPDSDSFEVVDTDKDTGKHTYVLRSGTENQRLFAAYVYLHGALFVADPDTSSATIPNGDVFFGWAGGPGPGPGPDPDPPGSKQFLDRSQIQQLRRMYDPERQLQTRMSFTGTSDDNGDAPAWFGEKTGNVSASDSVPGIVLNHHYMIGELVSMEQISPKLSGNETPGLREKLGGIFARRSFSLLLSPTLWSDLKEYTSFATTNKPGGDMTSGFYIDGIEQSSLSADPSVYHVPALNPWWFLDARLKDSLVFMSRLEVNDLLFKIVMGKTNVWRVEIPDRFLEYFKTVQHGGFSLMKNLQGDGMDFVLHVFGAPEEFKKSIITTELCTILTTQAHLWPLVPSTQGSVPGIPNPDHFIPGSVSDNSKTQGSVEFRRPGNVTKTIPPLRIIDIRPSTFPVDSNILDFLVRESIGLVRYGPPTVTDPSKYTADVRKMSTAGLLEYIKREEVVVALETLTQENQTKLETFIRRHQILEVNLTCGGVLRTLTSETVPAVRKNLLAYIRTFVDNATRDETTSELIRSRLAEKHCRAESRYTKANAMVDEATNYQNSQSSQLLEVSNLETVGRTIVRSNAVFLKATFLDEYGSRQHVH
jgi:Mn-dependent DtxR family transcriptional regulator